MSHDSDHHGDHDGDGELPPAFDPSIPDSELSPGSLSRRAVLRSAGLLGAGAAAANVLGPAAAAAAGPSGGISAGAAPPAVGGLHWLAGDHHIHTQYSPDAMYRVADQVRHAAAYGLQWMVITDHGGPAHAKYGVQKVNPDIRRARRQFPGMLVFQGLEWNIPAAEHGTVFVHPGANEVAVLKQFELNYDGVVKQATESTPANEALAIAGIRFLSRAVERRRVADALFLANHPSRKGVDSPHEVRAWRDTAPRVAIGMEGAPGHQAASIPQPIGPGAGRGYYDNSPSADSFAGYPAESYRTFGGFDWMTSTVGGYWDSLLAEGKPWSITANSDSHKVWMDVVKNAVDNDADAPYNSRGDTYNTTGTYPAPVYDGQPHPEYGDFWPGYYSRTYVGSTDMSYAAVMDGMRAGRIWVSHGELIRGFDVRARMAGSGKRGVPLGSTLHIRRGSRVEFEITVDLADTPNWAQFIPRLARLDVIQGSITGPVGNRDSFRAPDTRVVKSWEIDERSGTVRLTYAVRATDQPFYVRFRGTDGKETAPGLLGAAVDPHGPAMDVEGNDDPWQDLWFYSNPIFVLPRK